MVMRGGGINIHSTNRDIEQLQQSLQFHGSVCIKGSSGTGDEYRKFKNEVSIIIPMYNVEGYIENCIDSIINQSIKIRTEIILIDDCSSDRTMEIALKKIISMDNHILTDYSFLLIQQKENHGQGAARNIGLRKASGEYIVFIDSDDTIDKDFYKHLYPIIQNQNFDIIEGISTPVNEKGSILSYSDKEINNRMDSKILSKQEVWKIGNTWNPVCWNKIIRKDFLIKHAITFIEDVYYEDLHWAILISLANPIIFKANHLTYYYTIRNGSTTHSVSEKHLRSCKTILESLNKMNITTKKKWDYSTRTHFQALFEGMKIVFMDTILPRCTDIERILLLQCLKQFKSTNNLSLLFNPYLKIKQKAKLAMLSANYYAISTKSKI